MVYFFVAYLVSLLPSDASDSDVDPDDSDVSSGNLICNISNARRCVSSDIQTLRSRLKKRGAAGRVSVLVC